MKKLICCIVFLVFGFSGFSQNWNEWFRQKKTQIQYLYKQIAALQVYIELGQKGYGIYQDGLTLIGDIKDGDFNMHKDYFASLSTVNEYVGDLPEINEMLSWHKQIIKFSEVIDKQEIGIEKSSVTKLFNSLTQASTDNMHQLELLVTGGNYQLKDEERISQIKKVYAAQQSIYAFSRTTYNDVVGLKKQQSAEAGDVRIINSFHGLN